MISSLLITLLTQITIYFLFNFLRKKISFDKYEAIQKIHEGEIPRIGGLIFFIGFITLLILNKIDLFLILPLLCSSLFIFSFSFYEDVKQNLSPIFRLIILSIGSFIFVFFTNLPEINISFLLVINDHYYFLVLIFILSLMLIMNGFNFIDGLNGLSSFSFFSILLSIYYVANFYGDYFLTSLIIIIFLSSLVVFFLNFPFGKIFLGDSGSYLYAMISGSLVIYLFSRNPELPSLLAMVILAYPITEMLFSVFRKFFKGNSPLKPDTIHLHHLIFNRLDGNKFSRNNIASLMMLPFCILPFGLSYFSINYNLDNNFLKYLIFFLLYSMIYIFLSKSKINT
tara:strand:- start:59 stop:1078 length:1020 start_codon:yes stop_codon:yes gene_type:complete